MQKLRGLLGLPIVEIKSGEQIGQVQDLVLNIEKAAFVGVVLTDATWFSEAKGIYFNNIQRIGRDALMVREREAIVVLSDLCDATGLYSVKMLFDKEIYTEAGFHLGSLADFLFEEATGEIRAYEVSDGLITDLLKGRLIMPVPQAQVVGTDTLVVPESMAQMLRENNFS